jgi:hypothetical protein
VFNPHQTLEYKSLTDVINEVRDIFVIDISQHCYYLPSHFTDILLPAPAGIYAPNRLEPIFSFENGQAYYTANAYKARQAPDIFNFETFIRSNSPIYSPQGKFLCRAPASAPQFFQTQCAFNYSALHVAFILIYEMFSHLHSQTYVGTNLPLSALKLERYVRPEYLQAVLDERISHPGHANIAAETYHFIGRDRHSNYRLRFENTTLFLEKGNDYRVVEYYRRLFDELGSESY